MNFKKKSIFSDMVTLARLDPKVRIAVAMIQIGPPRPIKGMKAINRLQVNQLME